MRRIWSFLRALTGGRDRRLIAKRLKICDSCKFLRALPVFSPDTLQYSKKKYCTHCGCGTWALSELHHKLGWKRLSCPLGLWGHAGGLSPKEATASANELAEQDLQANNPDLHKQMQDRKQASADRAKARQAAQQPDGVVQRRPRAITEQAFRQSFNSAGPVGQPGNSHVGRQIFGPLNVGPQKGFNDGDQALDERGG